MERVETNTERISSESAAPEPAPLCNQGTAEAQRNSYFQKRIVEFSQRAMVAVTSPLHQARIADAGHRKAALARSAVRQQANIAEVPRDEDLRAIVEDESPYFTDTLLAVHRAMQWRGEHHTGLLLVLSGPPGVGKTAAACYALARYEAGGLYVRADQVCATPRTGYSTVEELWKKWLKISMLVIDDAGTESVRTDLLRSMLRARYDAGLVTFVTTNIARNDFSMKYLYDEHGRLADRLVNAQSHGVGDNVGEGGLDWYVEVDGDSLRSVEARRRLLKGSSR